MSRINLAILFVISKSRIKKNGTSPIYCRLTYNKKRRQFATGIFINPKHWDSINQKIIPPELEIINLNQKLSLIRQKLNQAFLFLQVNETAFTVDDIYSKYLGETPKKEVGVVEVYKMHTKRIEKLVGKEIQLVTYNKYKESGVHLKDFIKYKFKKKDIQLNSLKSNFLDEYEYFLKTEKNFQQSTLNKAIQRFRKVIVYALSENCLDRNPFLLYKPKTVKKEVVFLNQKELKSIEEHKFEIERLERVRDMFVFCCYSGLAFKEMTKLKKADIYEEFDGKLWIHIFRNKTNRVYKIPLLPKAKLIAEKYNNSNSELVLPKMNNQNFNGFLKEIASICGIKKHLTHHIARKTFATTVLLYNNVPMEIVSKLLGHSKIQTTQDHYGQIIDKKVSQEMIKLSSKIKNYE